MAAFSSNRVVKCCAVGCSNKPENGSHISFFKFPYDRARSVQRLLMLVEQFTKVTFFHAVKSNI